MVHKFLSLIFFFLGSYNSVAQTMETEVNDSIQYTHSMFPLAFYLPETGLGLGATGITTFRPSNEDATNRPSQFLYSAVYTFKKQLLLFFPYEIYLKENRHRIKGELGYYRYFYNYYGTGSKSLKEDLETYSVNFPRAEISYAYTRDKIWYYGGGIKFDYFDITEIEAGGLLETLRPIGYLGGTKFNIQLLLVRDNRDNIIAPSKGSYLELAAERNLPGFLSSFDYTKVKLDYRHFHSVRQNWILALRFISSHASAQTPFFDLEYLSSPQRARGFSDRRFIARNISTVQSELRYPIKKRLSGTLFMSANHVSDGDPLEFLEASVKFSYGAGLRFVINKKEQSKIRLDLASGDGTFNIYLTMNEAF